MTAPSIDRVCPLCDTKTGAADCAACGVPTVVATLFADKTGVVNTGTLIAGRYKVESVLGQGGMGAVYKANQLAVNRPVAIKTLLRDLVSDQKNVVRFYREAQAASQLDHPNIVRVFDFGIDDDTGAPFIVMEFLEGESLRELVARSGGLSERRACGLLAQVTKALIQAHDKGLVHRDLKPDNIHVRRLPDGDEHCKVLDFGLAKVVSGAQSESQQSLTGGTILGTPLYMSPEQIQQSGELDFRSDLYALGCILFQMLTGAAPFAGSDHMAVIVKHINEPPPPLPDILSDGQAPSAGVIALYEALLAKKPSERAASTVATSRALSALARGEDANINALLFAGLPTAPELKTVNLGLKPHQTAEHTHHAGIAPPSKTETGASVWLWVAILLLVGGGVAAFTMLDDDPVLPSTAQVDKTPNGGKVGAGESGESGETKKPEGEPTSAEGTASKKSVGIAVAKPAAGTVEEADKAGVGTSPPAAGGDPQDSTAEKADPEAEATVDKAVPVVAEVPVAPKVQVITAQPEAAVYQGEVYVGTTPQSIALPTDEATLELTIKAKGFIDQTVVLTAKSSAAASIVLQAVPKVEAPPTKPVAKQTSKKKKKKRAKAKKAEPAKKKIQVW